MCNTTGLKQNIKLRFLYYLQNAYIWCILASQTNNLHLTLIMNILNKINAIKESALNVLLLIKGTAQNTEISRNNVQESGLSNAESINNRTAIDLPLDNMPTIDLYLNNNSHSSCSSSALQFLSASAMTIDRILKNLYHSDASCRYFDTGFYLGGFICCIFLLKSKISRKTLLKISSIGLFFMMLTKSLFYAAKYHRSNIISPVEFIAGVSSGIMASLVPFFLFLLGGIRNPLIYFLGTGFSLLLRPIKHTVLFEIISMAIFNLASLAILAIYRHPERNTDDGLASNQCYGNSEFILKDDRNNYLLANIFTSTPCCIVLLAVLHFIHSFITMLELFNISNSEFIKIFISLAKDIKLIYLLPAIILFIYRRGAIRIVWSFNGFILYLSCLFAVVLLYFYKCNYSYDSKTVSLVNLAGAALLGFLRTYPSLIILRFRKNILNFVVYNSMIDWAISYANIYMMRDILKLFKKH
ncbi:hypothetical protein ENBRE01_2183 [Enteropsectra breve]|nr:hypothetical protein ENBRE01_2183 [Enteropsectra breve]